MVCGHVYCHWPGGDGYLETSTFLLRMYSPVDIPEDFSVPDRLLSRSMTLPCSQHVYMICWLHSELFGGKGCIVGDVAPSPALVQCCLRSFLESFYRG